MACTHTHNEKLRPQSPPGSSCITKERRQRYAEDLAALCGIGDVNLLKAFATVPREAFLPPGPWLIESADGSCYLSPDDNPERILHGVGIVLDPGRALHQASPSRIGRILQVADFQPGQTVLHVGAGVGYYSAIIAELVGPTGRVIAAEIDPRLAKEASRNLAGWPNVELVGDALSIDLPGLDRVFASCGMAAIPRFWLDALRPNGVMMLPMTGTFDGGPLFHIKRELSATSFLAQPLTAIYFYPCHGLRDKAQIDAFDAAFADGRAPLVKTLRLDDHPRNEECWLHGDGWCLSTAGSSLSPAPTSWTSPLSPISPIRAVG